MAVKNFVLRENSVDNKVAGMKATFFAIFDRKMDPYLGPQKTQIRNSFNSILVKKKQIILLSILTLRLTN